jgi:hypothetical protein
MINGTYAGYSTLDLLRMRSQTFRNVLKASLTYAGLLALFEGGWCLFNNCFAAFVHPMSYALPVVAFMVLAITGLVLAYAIGGPLLLGLRRAGLEHPFEVGAVATLLGALPFLALNVALNLDFSVVQLLLFTSAGALAGAVYVTKVYVVRFSNSKQV